MKSFLASKTLWVVAAGVLLAIVDNAAALGLPAWVYEALLPVAGAARVWRSNLAVIPGQASATTTATPVAPVHEVKP